MAKEIFTDFDFRGLSKIVGLPDSVDPTAAATVGQVNSTIEGLKWKAVKTKANGNVNLLSPGTTIGGVTMAPGYAFLVADQTVLSQNGIYSWVGAALPATRAASLDESAEFNNAIAFVELGDSINTNWRQVTADPVIGTSDIVFIPFFSSSPVATNVTNGVTRIATLAEVNSGASINAFVTPETLAQSVYASKKVYAFVGDGVSLSYTVTHNLGTRDLIVQLRKATGDYAIVTVADITMPTVNTINILFSLPPAVSEYRVNIRS